MKIGEIQAKSIIVKSNLPESDFVINPYTGCFHKCLYCYARFMKRFTGHPEPWGDFVDAKVNAPDLIKDPEKYKGRSITIGSVTDPYQPAEAKYQLTRKILEKLIPVQPHLDIITKSHLVTRDIDLLKQFLDGIVAISLSLLDEKDRRIVEPQASSVDKRISALKILHENQIPTALFISPIFPYLSDWRQIIETTKDFVDEYWFENLNLYPSISGQIYEFLDQNHPDLVSRYREIYSQKSNYWNQMETDIIDFCQKHKINYHIYFHHREIRKNK